MAGTCNTSRSNLVSSRHRKVRPCSTPTLGRWRLLGVPSLNSSSSTLSKSSLSKCLLLRASVAEGPTSSSTTSTTLLTQEVEVTFTWKGKGSEVLLSGEFVDWQKQIPLEKTPEGTFQLKQKLAPGVYKFKFIVDGEWMHSADFPTSTDGIGGLNNEITVASSESTQAKSTSETSSKVKEKPAVAKEKPSPKAEKPSKPAAKKAAVVKDLPELMIEDVIPALKSKLDKEDGVKNVVLAFKNNQLQGSFSKGTVPYSFWAYFPEGKVTGVRGFSVSAYGTPPSTVEPFLVDESKITAQLLVFWFHKRLCAQSVFTN